MHPYCSTALHCPVSCITTTLLQNSTSLHCNPTTTLNFIGLHPLHCSPTTPMYCTHYTPHYSNARCRSLQCPSSALHAIAPHCMLHTLLYFTDRCSALHCTLFYNTSPAKLVNCTMRRSVTNCTVFHCAVLCMHCTIAVVGWLGSSTTNSHGVAAFDFATVSGCHQLVVGPTDARGGILDLLMTDVPDLIRVAVVAPIGNSDLSSFSAVISTAQAVPNLCVSR